MPMLTVANTSWPARASGSRSTAWMRSATATASSRASRSSSRIVNSSPPRRATVSPGRTAVLSALLSSMRSRSPTLWPRLSLTSLKRSTSRKSDREQALVVAAGGRALQAGEGGLEPVDEERAVGQAGERVVEGVVLELLLRAAAVGHVGPDGSGARDLARPVPEDRVAPGDDAPVPVPRDDGRLLVGGDRPELHAVAQGDAPRLALLLRHEGGQPVAPDHVLLLVAHQLEEVGVAVGDDAVTVQEHGHQLHVLEDVAHAALGFAHGFFGAAALGDVEGGDQQAGRPAKSRVRPVSSTQRSSSPGQARLVAQARPPPARARAGHGGARCRASRGGSGRGRRARGGPRRGRRSARSAASLA